MSCKCWVSWYKYTIIIVWCLTLINDKECIQDTTSIVLNEQLIIHDDETWQDIKSTEVEFSEFLQYISAVDESLLLQSHVIMNSRLSIWFIYFI